MPESSRDTSNISGGPAVEGHLLHAQQSLTSSGNRRGEGVTEGNLLHAAESVLVPGSGIVGGGAGGLRAAGSQSPGGSSASATLAEGGHRRSRDARDVFNDEQERGGAGAAGAAAGATAARTGDFRPISYLFEDRNTATPASFSIPELQSLTVDVPARDQVSIFLGPFVIILCDLVIPCIIYYTWLSNHPEPPGYDHDILGVAIVPFGLGELYILMVRVWRLIRYREECAPLLSRHWWELDATSFIYASALIAGLVPFTVGSALAIPEIYLYSPGLYMCFLFVWSLITLVPFKIPVRVDSEERGSRMRPIVYYAAEDFFAVDGWQRREFREKYRERYETSIMFRKMIFELTVWWLGGFIVYIGCLSAVIWKQPFHIAFGLSLGLLFTFIISWALATYLYVQYALERERDWWIQKKSSGAEKA